MPTGRASSTDEFLHRVRSLRDGQIWIVTASSAAHLRPGKGDLNTGVSASADGGADQVRYVYALGPGDSYLAEKGPSHR